MRVNIFLVVILLFGLLLSTCEQKDDMFSSVPKSSEVFSEDFCESFADNYDVKDFHLAYLKADPWNVCVKTNDIKEKYSRFGNLEKIYLAKIINADIEQYVCGTSYNRIFNEIVLSSYIYQHKDAPIPMLDWTIKEINIYVSDNAYGLITHKSSTLAKGDFSEAISLSENLMQKYLDNARVVTTITDKESFDSVKKAYGSEGVLSPKKRDMKNAVYSPYYMVVSFEENSNIIWYSPLAIDKDEIVNIQRAYHESRYDITYEVLDKELSNKILEAVIADGWENPIPQITTDTPHSAEE